MGLAGVASAIITGHRQRWQVRHRRSLCVLAAVGSAFAFLLLREGAAHCAFCATRPARGSRALAFQATRRLAASGGGETSSDTVWVIRASSRYPVQWAPTDTVDELKARVEEATGVPPERQELITAERASLEIGTRLQEYVPSSGDLRNLWLKEKAEEVVEAEKKSATGEDPLIEGWIVGIIFVVMCALILSPVTAANFFGYGKQGPGTGDNILDGVLERAPETKIFENKL